MDHRLTRTVVAAALLGAPLTLAGAGLVASAAPSSAAGPPVPTGCSFNQSTGVLTCTTTTTSAVTEGPFNTPGALADPAYGGVAVYGDYTGTQICIAKLGNPPSPTWLVIAMQNAFVTNTLTTTTTTQSHGLHGEVFATSSTSSSALSVTGGVECGFPSFNFGF